MKAAASRAHRVPLGVALAVRRQIKRETGAIPVNQRGRFDPRK